MITAGNVIDDAAKLLQDETNVRWPRPELLIWLNAGQREIVKYKPDACSTIASVSLVAGTLQSLPAGAIMLLDVPRNMGVNGGTPGRVIRLVDREILDSQIPGWHSLTGKQEILHYMVDWRTPTRYYVYPPAAVPTSVEIMYSVSPTPCAGEQSVISINEIYANDLLNYVLYRSFSKETEFAADPAQAKTYYQMFAQGIGIEVESAARSAPKTTQQSNPNVRK